MQECLTPDITVTRGASVGARASITSVEWRGMRCLVDAVARGGVVHADLRLKRASGDSVVVTSKPLDEGFATLLLDGDEHEDAELVLVLVDEGGIILAHKPTRVGEST